MVSLEDDLGKLSPADLLRVRRWVEDRFVNAISPLAIRLQLLEADAGQAARTIEEARAAVSHVLEHVEEVRSLAAGFRPGE